jgi:DNA-binding IclR family transcriptional regulator
MMPVDVIFRYLNSVLYAKRMVRSLQAAGAGGPQTAPDNDRGATESTATPSGTQPVKSAGRALDILEDLAAHGPSSLHTMAKRLDLPKSSLHALLRTMEGRGWVETDVTGNLYHLGIHTLLVGSAYLDGEMIVGRINPILDELAGATGEAVHLARLEGDQVIYMAKRESTHPLRMFSAVGRRLPAHTTALGRAMLAELPDERVRAMLPAKIEQVTPHTTTDPEQLLSILADARLHGYAVESQESCLGVGCFAVALPLSEPAKDAISIAVPLARLDDALRADIIERLLEVRRRLQEQPFSRNWRG